MGWRIRSRRQVGRGSRFNLTGDSRALVSMSRRAAVANSRASAGERPKGATNAPGGRLGVSLHAKGDRVGLKIGRTLEREAPGMIAAIGLR